MIVNPVNNQMYRIHSIKGRELLKIYIDNYKNGGMKRKIDSTDNASRKKARQRYAARRRENIRKQILQKENEYRLEIDELNSSLFNALHKNKEILNFVITRMKELSKKIAIPFSSHSSYFQKWINKPFNYINDDFYDVYDIVKNLVDYDEETQTVINDISVPELNGTNYGNLVLNGETPLIYSSTIGNYDVVRELIKNGAYLHQKNKKEETALTKAVKNGHLKVVKLLCMRTIERYIYLAKKWQHLRSPAAYSTALDNINSAIIVAKNYRNDEITTSWNEYWAERLINILKDTKEILEEKAVELEPQMYQLYHQKKLSDEPVFPEEHDIFNPTKPTSEDGTYFSEEMATPEELKGLVGPGGTALKYYEAADIPEFNPGKPMRIDDKRKPMTLGEIKTSDKRPTGILLDQLLRDFYEDANPVGYLPREYKTMVGFHAKGDGLKKTNDIIKPPQILLKRIEDMKVAELKRELKGYKQSTAGKKAELIKRLKAVRNNNVEEPEPTIPLPPPPPRRLPARTSYSRPVRNLSFPQRKGNPGGRMYYSDFNPIHDFIKDYDPTIDNWEYGLIPSTSVEPTPLPMTFKHGTEK